MVEGYGTVVGDRDCKIRKVPIVVSNSNRGQNESDREAEINRVEGGSLWGGKRG